MTSPPPYGGVYDSTYSPWNELRSKLRRHEDPLPANVLVPHLDAVHHLDAEHCLDDDDHLGDRSGEKDAFQQFSAQHVVISFSEDDAVYFVSSSDGGTTWGTPIEVSTVSETTKQPDMIVDSLYNIHFDYSVLVSGKYDIKYRNGVLTQG